MLNRRKMYALCTLHHQNHLELQIHHLVASVAIPKCGDIQYTRILLHIKLTFIVTFVCGCMQILSQLIRKQNGIVQLAVKMSCYGEVCNYDTLHWTFDICQR